MVSNMTDHIQKVRGVPKPNVSSKIKAKGQAFVVAIMESKDIVPKRTRRNRNVIIFETLL